MTVQDLVTLVSVMILMVHSASTYPYNVRQRKADPFVALASSLRQQDQQLDTPRDSVYAYGDYGGVRGGVGPTEDDLWRLEQLQRQLGRAAVMPFYAGAVRPQRSWGNVVTADQDDLEAVGSAAEYGIPVEEVDDGGVWYEDGIPPSSVEDQERQKQEAELLLNTLAEYMLMYDSDKHLPEESKRANPIIPTSDVPSEATITPAATNTPTASTSMLITPPHYSLQSQPPVEKSDDGTPMGQKEFPMMRPATPQRQKWLTTQGKLDFTSKRHSKSKSHIVMPEDRLTQELDNLKAKKN